MQGISVFSGSAHPDLAAAVCTHLDIPLYRTEIRRFSNDCIYVQLLESCRESDVYLFQPLAPPVQEHVMELLQMLDAARSSSAARITAVIPYYAYARSDKKDAPRISIAGRLLADLLATAGATRVLTMTLHSPQVHGFFSVPVDHLNALNELAAHFKQRDMSNAIVVSPDLGHAKPADQLARLLKVPLAAGSKRRVSDDKVVVDTIVGDVEGKDAIVIDDEISTAGTIIEILDKLRERGGQEPVGGHHARRPVRAGHRPPARPARSGRDRHHRYRPGAAREAPAEYDGALDGAVAVRGHPPHSRRRVDQQHV